jgi:hypothetical protein
MPVYGTRSLAVRETLHPHLREIFEAVLDRHDHALEHGARSPVEQQAAFDSGHSQKHGINPDGTVADYPHAPRDADGEPDPGGTSWAVDVWPWVKSRRLEVLDIPDLIRRVEAGDAAAFVKSALLGYMQFAYFIRLVQDVAIAYFDAQRQITGERWRLKSGADWNMDGDITDTGFLDAPHFELVRET